MRTTLGMLLLFAAFAVAVTAPTTLLAGTSDSVNLGIGASNFLPHCNATIYLAEFEHMVGERISAVGRVSSVHYTFDDGNHVEDGRPRGVDIGARYYFSDGMKGIFISGLVGYWTSDWTFMHNKELPNEFQGQARSNSVRANVDIGARIPLGDSPVSIIPSFNFGRYFSSSSCDYTAPASRVGTPCNEDSEVTNYAFLALSFGIGF